MTPTRFSAPYWVHSHELVKHDDKLVRVNLRCLGYPTYGAQPEEWDFAIKVPQNELSNWPLGSMVRLTVPV